MLQLSIASHATSVTYSDEMDALEIIYRLKRLGVSQADIARQLQVSQAVVSNTIHSRVTCYRVAAHVAGLLGETAQTLWPDRYCFRPRKPRNQGGDITMT
jgi:Ner family transcriptional regulator